MRTAITMVRRHGDTRFEIVTGPEVPVHEQIADAKKVAQAGDRTHPEYAEVQVWISDTGISKTLRFKPEPTPEVALPQSPVEAVVPAAPDPEVELPTESTPKPTRNRNRK